MLSLAAYRYRNILTASAGPIERLQLVDMRVLGQREFLSLAFLREGLAGKQWANTVFNIADGGGTAAFPGVLRRQCRAGALMAAAARFNLLNWWEGCLPASNSDTP